MINYTDSAGSSPVHAIMESIQDLPTECEYDLFPTLFPWTSLLTQHTGFDEKFPFVKNVISSLCANVANLNTIAIICGADMKSAPPDHAFHDPVVGTELILDMDNGLLCQPGTCHCLN